MTLPDTGVLDLVPILKLRQLLNLAMVPIEPRKEFRTWLKNELDVSLTATGRRYSRSEWFERGDWLLKPGRREIIIGAALGSAFSLAGLIALLIHVRISNRSATTEAA